MNNNIKLVGDSSKWKNGLKKFGVNTRNMKDDPDTWYWGNSSQFNWEPCYDFDPYKLWCFLCAYYYNFDVSDNGDITYWKYSSDTETLLQELFDAEYQFVYWYDNTRNIPLITIGAAVLRKQAHITAVKKKHTSMTEGLTVIGSSQLPLQMNLGNIVTARAISVLTVTIVF